MGGRLRSEALGADERLQRAAENRPPLGPGNAGPAVGILQSVLGERGFSVETDSIYGGRTANAVCDFQRAHGLQPVDGIAGSSVLTTLDALLLEVDMPADELVPRFHVARQDAYATLNGAPPPWHAPPPVEDPVYGRVHVSTTTLLKRLIRAGQQTLTAFGCGKHKSRPLFDWRFSQLIARIQTEHPLPVQSRADGDPRRELLRLVLCAFGASHVIPSATQQALLSAPGVRPSFFSEQKIMARIFASACGFHGRLETLLERCYEPFRGRDQLFDLLAEFPALADDVYAEAGLSGVSGFPPVAGSGASREGILFARAGAAWVAAEEREATRQTVGLVIAGIAVGILSFGLLSGFVATLATMGFGLTQSTYHVVDRSLALQSAEDARAIGAGSDALVDYRRAQLGGAWAGLLIDAVTMRFGAAIGASVGPSQLTKYLAVNAIDATSNAAAMLADPDVRNSPGVVGTVLFGVVVGFVAGEATVHIGGRLQVMSSMPGAPVAGTPVRVATGPEQPPVDGVVTAVRGNTIEIRTRGSDVTVDVQRVGTVRVRPPAAGTYAVVKELSPKLQYKASAVPGSCSSVNQAIGGLIFVESGGTVRPHVMRDGMRRHTYLKTEDGTFIDGAYYQFFEIGAERPRVFVGTREEFLVELDRLHTKYGWNRHNDYISGRLAQFNSAEEFFVVYYERAYVGLSGETLYTHQTRHGPKAFYRGE